MNAFRAQHMGSDGLHNRVKRNDAGADTIGERGRVGVEAHGEFESECPGYCGAQDTFYVGNMKGVGCIYQQTFVDTYSKVTFAKPVNGKLTETYLHIVIGDEHAEKRAQPEQRTLEPFETSFRSTMLFVR